MHAELISFFFSLSNTVKLYHWSTNLYSRHKSSDDLFGIITSLTDKFMETYQGKYGKISRSNIDDIDIKSKIISDDNFVMYLRNVAQFLEDIAIEAPSGSKTQFSNRKNKFLSSKDTDLLNIRDELLGEINKSIYLLTFN